MRRGRGVRSTDLLHRIGPHLTNIVGVSADDNTEDIRRRVTTRLSEAVTHFPEELGQSVEAAFGLSDSFAQPLLAERVELLAGLLMRNPRTARRRIDDALRHLAARLAQDRAESNREWAPYNGWRIRRCRTLLKLDGPAPEALEERDIEAAVDGLDQVDLTFGVPRVAHRSPAAQELEIEVFFGGLLVNKRRESGTRFGYTLRLPRILPAGGRTTYMLRYRIPAGQPMRNHYVFSPSAGCDSFTLHVKFGERPPASVTRLSDTLPGDVDDLTFPYTRLPVDSVGEISTTFTDLKPLLGYGLRWESPDTTG